MTWIREHMRKLDPRSKILGVLISLAVLAFSRNGSVWLHLINMMPAAILALVQLRQPWRIIVRFKYVSLFLIIAVFFHMGLYLSVPSLQIIGYRAFTYILSTTFCGICAGLFLTTTTSASDFARGMMNLGLPVKATWMISLAHRFLPLMYEEVHHTFSAAGLRGFRWYSKRGRDFARLTAGLTQRACDHALQTGNAMFLRGFDMSTRHSKAGPLTRRDYLFLLGFPSTYMMIRLVIS